MPSLAMVWIVLGLALSGGAAPPASGETENVRLLFVRKGGGSLTFELERISPEGFASVTVSIWSFRPCDIRFDLRLDADNAELLPLISRMLKGTELLEGDFEQPRAHTGTWAYLYRVEGGQRQEITQKPLREAFLRLERLVQEEMIRRFPDQAPSG